jgi:hypothetical protein
MADTDGLASYVKAGSFHDCPNWWLPCHGTLL